MSELAQQVARLGRRLERERAIRFEAEAIAEKGLRELYDRQRQLELLERIAAAANQMNSVRDVLQFAIEQFCQFADWTLGHAFVNRDGVLRSFAAALGGDYTRVLTRCDLAGENAGWCKSAVEIVLSYYELEELHTL